MAEWSGVGEWNQEMRSERYLGPKNISSSWPINVFDVYTEKNG